jgi:hypothetical protein
MSRIWKNNAYSTFASAINTTDTTITVASGEGARFPVAGSGATFALTLQDASNNIEIVLCTTHTSGADTFTVTRAQEGTTARSWSIGDVIELRLTASALQEMVTLTGTQTLTNKTLTSPTISGTVSLDLDEGNWQVGGTTVTATAAELNLLDGLTATSAELNYIAGVTSNIQDQLDAKSTLDGELGNATAETISFGDWQIGLEGTSLVFSYDGAAKFALTSDGELTVIDDVVAFGSL